MDRPQSVTECLFRPGRFLDRQSHESNEDEGSPELSAAKRRRRADAPGKGPGEEGLLFSRVKVKQDGGDDMIKARVTAISGERLEVITEGNWKEMNVHVGSVLEIDESNFVTGKPDSSLPTDFGFLMN